MSPTPTNRTEPPCFSCGHSKFEPAPEGCLDKRNHTYLCPTSGEMEHHRFGGFDVCCDDPKCPSNMT